MDGVKVAFGQHGVCAKMCGGWERSFLYFFQVLLHMSMIVFRAEIF